MNIDEWIIIYEYSSTRDYTSGKTGKTTTKYYAVVFDSKQKKQSGQSRVIRRSVRQREEARMLRDLEENIRLSGKVIFQEIAKSWTDSSAENYASSTFQGYLWYLSRYLLPVF